MCWNKGRLCWKIAKLFYFCHLRKLFRPETFWTLLRTCSKKRNPPPRLLAVTIVILLCGCPVGSQKKKSAGSNQVLLLYIEPSTFCLHCAMNRILINVSQDLFCMQNIQPLNYLATAHVSYYQIRSPVVFAAQSQHETINTNENLVQYYDCIKIYSTETTAAATFPTIFFKRNDLVHLRTLVIVGIYFLSLRKFSDVVFLSF